MKMKMKKEDNKYIPFLLLTFFEEKFISKNLVKPMITGFSYGSELKSGDMKTGWWGMLLFVVILSLVFYVWGLEPLQMLFS